MVRIAGVTIPSDKRVIISLTYIFGIGKNLSNKILVETKVDPEKRVKDLTEEEVSNLRNEIEKKYSTEGDKKREIISNIKRLKEINSYKGTRHSKKLPVRGQRTKTNNRTVRGNSRRTMGSGKVMIGQKT